MTTRMAMWLLRKVCRVNNFYAGEHPPMWLRHFVPNRVLEWINDNLPVCGGQPFLWKELASDSSWIPRRYCWSGYDYCGKYDCPNAVAAAIDEWNAPAWTISFKEKP